MNTVFFYFIVLFFFFSCQLNEPELLVQLYPPTLPSSWENPPIVQWELKTERGVQYIPLNTNFFLTVNPTRTHFITLTPQLSHSNSIEFALLPACVVLLEEQLHSFWSRNKKEVLKVYGSWTEGILCDLNESIEIDAKINWSKTREYINKRLPNPWFLDQDKFKNAIMQEEFNSFSIRSLPLLGPYLLSFPQTGFWLNKNPFSSSFHAQNLGVISSIYLVEGIHEWYNIEKKCHYLINIDSKGNFFDAKFCY